MKKKPITAYDIEEAFRIIEDDLLQSLSKKLNNFIDDGPNADVSYEFWQAEQLKALHQYRFIDDKHFRQRYSKLNTKIKKLLNQTWNKRRLQEVNAILRRVSGVKKETVKASTMLLLNKEKLDALVKSVTMDFATAELATLRMMDDQYRKIIFNSQVYLNTGSGTLRGAIDMATKDFFANGITSIQYKNGARVNITSYAEMALRTAEKRAALQGEADARSEYGLDLVIINYRGTACPKCQKFVGRVCIDNVWGNGQPDGKHPLLSDFIAQGLYHPNCKDGHSTYYPGVSPAEKPMTKADQAEATRIYNLEQKQRYNERQIRKYKRLEANSLEEADITYARNKRKEWQARQRQFVNEHDELRRKYDREKIYDSLQK